MAGANKNYVIEFANVAVSGSFVADMVSRAAAVDAKVNPDALNVLTVLCGRNDLGSASPNVTLYLQDLASYCNARRAAGWYVVLGTLLPSTATNFNTNRATANTELRLWPTSGSTVPGKHVDSIVDFAANATIGVDAAAADLTYYFDGTHPTDACKAIMTTVLAGVLNPLLATT